MPADSVTYEIIRHKLWQIADEMGVTLKRVSGSPTTTEANDLLVALYLSNGDLLIAGWGISFHVSSAAAACKHIMSKFSNDPGIFEDDMFLLNDPYVAALHTSDIYIISPIHYKNEIAAWSTTFTHVPDIGAIDPGGFAPSATHIVQEGVRIPGIKLIEKGKMRRDIFESIINMTREPEMVGLDISSQIAANNVAKRRFHDLIERYGLNHVQDVEKRMVRNSEVVVRSRLEKLPDGSWENVEFLDILGKIYKLALKMKKEKGKLLFDFTGSSQQAPCGLNGTYLGTKGAVFASIAPLMCSDIPWNEGIFKTFDLIAPEGTIVNCKYPAPTSIATVGALYITTNAGVTVLSKMLGASNQYWDEVTAVWRGSSAVLEHSGLNQEGRYYVGMMMDQMAGSGGARAFGDGVDTGGLLTALQASCANVERYESIWPILYLFRRHVSDSGGPGKFRGGASGEYSIILHDARGGKIDCTLAGMGLEPAQSHGLFGGYPGCMPEFILYRGFGEKSWKLQTDISKLPDGTNAKVERLPPQSVFEITNSDAFYIRWSGGGGYGDPLDRDPDLVLNDLAKGLVSQEAAMDVYGVVISPDFMSVSRAETDALRKRLKEKRREKSSGKR